MQTITHHDRVTFRSIIAGLRAAQYPTEYLLLGLRLGAYDAQVGRYASAPMRRAIRRVRQVAVAMASRKDTNLIALEAYRAVAR